MATLDQRIDGQIAALQREANDHARMVAYTLRREREMETARCFALVLLIDWLVEKFSKTKNS
jgi:hypothetical protein